MFFLPVYKRRKCLWLGEGQCQAVAINRILTDVIYPASSKFFMFVTAVCNI